MKIKLLLFVITLQSSEREINRTKIFDSTELSYQRKFTPGSNWKPSTRQNRSLVLVSIDTAIPLSVLRSSNFLHISVFSHRLHSALWVESFFSTKAFFISSSLPPAHCVFCFYTYHSYHNIDIWIIRDIY